MNDRPCLRQCLILLAFISLGELGAAEKTNAGQIQVTMLGQVSRTGKIPLPPTATIDDAFVAAGGYNPEEKGAAAHGGRPAIYCVLMTRDHGVDMNMQVHVKVDRKTRIVRVIDDARRAVPLKDGDTIILPVITR